MTIAIDIDGTIAQNHAVWLERYNRDYNDNVRVEDIKDWDMDKYVKCGKKIYDYLKDPNFYDTVLPIPNALEAINKMREYHRIVYATDCSPGVEASKYNWLIRHGFLDKRDDFIVCKDKSLIRTEILIDDYIENIKNFTGVGVLYRQPWNSQINVVFEIDNWEHFEYIFWRKLESH